MEKFTTKEGLKELPVDDRDFALGGVFGEIDINEVPNTDFYVHKPLRIKNQGDTDQCSAFAVTSVSEDQEAIELMPAYQFYSTKRLTGNKEEWGADLRNACKSAVKYGSLPKDFLPEMNSKSRTYILENNNWPRNADGIARIYKKETYFAVTGKYDTFDNIRAALWQHRENYCSIVTGAFWRSAWIDAKNGIIPNVESDGFGHAFKIFGQKVIDGTIYLVAQLSNGTECGDGGLYYFSREITNKELSKYGLFMFKDISRADAEYYLTQPFTVNTPWYKAIFAILSSIFNKKTL